MGVLKCNCTFRKISRGYENPLQDRRGDFHLYKDGMRGAVAYLIRSVKRSNPVNGCGGIRTGLLKVCL